MSTAALLVAFLLDGQRYALPVEAVERIVRAVEVTPLAGAPPAVLGIIDVAGEVQPVLDLRVRLGLRSKALDVTDQFIIARTPRRIVVLIVEQVLGMVESPARGIVPVAQFAPELAHIRGAIQLEDGLVLIQDLELVLTPEEEKGLTAALEGGRTDGP